MALALSLFLLSLSLRARVCLTQRGAHLFRFRHTTTMRRVCVVQKERDEIVDKRRSHQFPHRSVLYSGISSLCCDVKGATHARYALVCAQYMKGKLCSYDLNFHTRTTVQCTVYTKCTFWGRTKWSRCIALSFPVCKCFPPPIATCSEGNLAQPASYNIPSFHPKHVTHTTSSCNFSMTSGSRQQQQHQDERGLPMEFA